MNYVQSKNIGFHLQLNVGFRKLCGFYRHSDGWSQYITKLLLLKKQIFMGRKYHSDAIVFYSDITTYSMVMYVLMNQPSYACKSFCDIYIAH